MGRAVTHAQNTTHTEPQAPVPDPGMARVARKRQPALASWPVRRVVLLTVLLLAIPSSVSFVLPWFGLMMMPFSTIAISVVAVFVLRELAGESERARAAIRERDALDTRLRELGTVSDRTLDVEEFVYAVSHDLKSPMVSVQGFAEYLKEEVEAGRLDLLSEFADNILEASGRMRRLVDDLLELSRMGRVPFELEHVSAGPLTEELIDRLAARIEQAGATVTVRGGLPSVSCDRAMLARALENLIENALKYGAVDGRELSIEVGGGVERGRVNLWVADNGPGIAVGDRERVFALFARLHSGDLGSGIGLATVRRVAELHGGRAWVESGPGGGTRVRIELPASELGARAA